jgi:hypothetical protein
MGANLSSVLQERVDAVVEIASRAMVRGDDEGVVGIANERLRDRTVSLVPTGERVYPALISEPVDR